LPPPINPREPGHAIQPLSQQSLWARCLSLRARKTPFLRHLVVSSFTHRGLFSPRVMWVLMWPIDVATFLGGRRDSSLIPNYRDALNPPGLVSQSHTISITIHLQEDIDFYPKAEPTNISFCCAFFRCYLGPSCQTRLHITSIHGMCAASIYRMSTSAAGRRTRKWQQQVGLGKE
jgi:hypothetical protein